MDAALLAPATAPFFTIAPFFGPAATLGDIARMDPEGSTLSRATGREIDRVIQALEDLGHRSRKLSLSVLVPMGSEMAYRYQENLIHETLAVLRAFRARWEKAREERPPLSSKDRPA